MQENRAAYKVDYSNLAANEKMKLAGEIAKLGYFDRDIINNTLVWSDQAYRNLGLSPYEVAPSTKLFLKLVYPEDLAMVKERIRAPGKASPEFEHRIIKPDGSIAWMHIFVHTVWDEEGKLIRSFGAVQDVTEQKLLELELQKLTEELQRANNLLVANQRRVALAGEIVKVGFFEWDIANKTLYWSDQQYRNFGFSPQEFIPTPAFLRNRIYPDDLDLITTAIAKIPTEKYHELQFRIIKRDGSVGRLYARITAVTDEQGMLVKIFGTTQENSKQMQAEECLQGLEKELVIANQIYIRSFFLNRLITREHSPIESKVTELSEFGIDAKTKHCCFVFLLAEEGFTADITKEKQAVLIWLAEKELGWVWKFGEDVILLVPARDNVVNKQAQLEFSRQLLGEMGKMFPHICAKVGVSGFSGIPVELRGLYEKAHRAAIVAVIVNNSQAVHWEDIGLYEFSFQLLKDKNTCAMVQKTIGRLAEYDRDHGSSLLLTLECLLEGISLKAVAQKLFIHHNTAVWRKRRIEKLLGISLDNVETKALVILYFKIWKLQKLEIN